MASLKRQIFEDRVVTALGHADDANFLEGVEDVSRYVIGDMEGMTINRTYLGVHPTVLVNNTTYPIPVEALADENIPISLDKHQTTQTPISDDDMYASTYDRIDAVNKLHVEAIVEKKYDRAAHALAPQNHSASTPILITTGADDGTGRKKLTKTDVINFRRALKKFRTGMRVVWCDDHINDILEWDENFDKQFADNKTGLVSNKWGFESYAYSENPYFTVATKTKLSFGAVPGAGDRQCSFAFLPKRAVKANGKTKFYISKSEDNPGTQSNLMNYRHYAIAMPTVIQHRGAIVSGIPA